MKRQLPWRGASSDFFGAHSMLTVEANHLGDHLDHLPESDTIIIRSQRGSDVIDFRLHRGLVLCFSDEVAA